MGERLCLLKRIENLLSKYVEYFLMLSGVENCGEKVKQTILTHLSEMKFSGFLAKHSKLAVKF